MGPASTVTISFKGGGLVPGLPKQVTLDLAEPVTIGVLIDRLEQTLARPDLRAALTQYYIFVVNGTTIQHQQGWDTIVTPGSTVAVLAPMGGGATRT